MEYIPADIAGRWQIVDTQRGAAATSTCWARRCFRTQATVTGSGLFVVLAYINAKPAKTRVSLTWQGAWLYDQVSGAGSATLGAD